MKSLHLAGENDAPKILPLVAAFHAEMGFDTSDTHRQDAVLPLLSGVPHGAIWLIGPRRAPVGYLAVSFGWSLEFGGMDAMLDEFYIRPTIRKRGMGAEALSGLCQALAGSDVRALSLEADSANDTLQRFYLRAHFAPRPGYALMTRPL